MPGRSKAVFVLMTAIIAAISVIAAGCGEKNTGRAAEKSTSGFESGEADTVRHNGDENGAAAGAAVEPEAVEVNADWYTANPEAADFTISTADELAALAHIVNGTARGISQDDFSGKTIVLAGNIDLSGYGNWVPVGKNGRPDGRDVFRGTFDGGWHVIKNLTINHPEEAYQGLFGIIRGGAVKNLGVENVNVSAGKCVGGIAGGIGNSGGISNCRTTGKVGGREDVGGIAGYVVGGSGITHSYSAAAVSVSIGYAGGLAGLVYSGSISNSYFTGSVSGVHNIGGLAGCVDGRSAVTGCYSTGAVTGMADNMYIGGLAGHLAGHVDGWSRMSNCAALGPKITGGSRWTSGGPYYGGLGRVAVISDLYYNNAFNAAWAGMKNSAGNVDWYRDGPNGEKHGLDITSDEIRADPTMKGRFTAENGWTIEKGKLPGLFGEAVKFPAHLNATVYCLNNSLADMSLPAGEIHKFTATVWGIRRVDKSVRWAVTGNTSETTTVDASGLLAIGGDETAAYITVTATAAADTSISAAAKVKIDTLRRADTRWYADNPEADSFTISTAGELAGLAQIVNGTTWGGKSWRDNFGGKTIKLAGNIDLSAYKNWKPIGNYAFDTQNVFSGTFDGGGHVISRLTVKARGNGVWDELDEWCGYGKAGYQGLFGYIRGGSVENLGLDGVNVRGGKNVGGIAGVITGHSRIAGCYSSGKVEGVRYPVGGVAGLVDDHSSIANSYSSGIVHSCHGTGGVAGNVSRNSSVANCYSTAEITNSSETGFSGGVAGSVSDGSTVTNSYFAGKNSCSLYGYAGGVAGGAASDSKVTNCAALNPDLICYGDALGSRIVGGGYVYGYRYNFENPTLSNNVAYAGMIVPSSRHRYGANRQDGAGITAAQIRADGTLGGRFTPENGWTTENGKLPGLRGKAMELPRHLR